MRWGGRSNHIRQDGFAAAADAGRGNGAAPLAGRYDSAGAGIHCRRCRSQLPWPVRNVTQPQAAAPWRSSLKLNG